MKIKKVLTLSLLIGILAGAAGLRLIALDRFSFWNDEIYHVEAAKSFNERGDFFVAYEGQYHRAKLVTYITAASFRLLGVSERSARLPFSLINLLFLVLAGWLVSKAFSPVIGFLFSFFMAFSPLAIELSRECRMYTLFQFFYFFGAFLFLYGAEGLLWNIGSKIIGWGKRILCFLISGVFLGLAFHFQMLAANFAIVATMYVAVCWIFLAADIGHGEVHRRRYLIYVCLLIFSFSGLVLINRHLVENLFSTAVVVPESHAFINPLNNWQFYRHYFMDRYPALFFMAPIGAFVLIRHFGRKGIFVAINFFLLFLLHSLVFQRKADRYIFYLLPFFFICSAAGIEMVGRSLIFSVRNEGRGLPSRLAKIVLFVCSLPLLFWFVHPWIVQSVKNMSVSKFPDWKSINPSFWKELHGSAILASNPKEFLYYSGLTPKYYLTKDPSPNHVMEPGWLQSDDDFFGVYKAEDQFILVTTRFTLANQVHFSLTTQRFIKEMMELVPTGSESDILVYKKIKARP